MKKILLGVLITVVFSSINHEIWYVTESGAIHDASWFIENSILQGNYLLYPINGNCVDQQGENGHGWKFNIADYYRCDRFQRLLNGNFKKPNPDSLR